MRTSGTNPCTRVHLSVDVGQVSPGHEALSSDLVLNSFHDRVQENRFREIHHTIDTILDAYSGLDKPYVTDETGYAAIQN
jgi:hypothetical protein